MRAAVEHLPRFIVTPAVTKHRLFVWLPSDTLADHQVVVIARDDDYTFGVLQSRVHEAWASPSARSSRRDRATHP